MVTDLAGGGGREDQALLTGVVLSALVELVGVVRPGALLQLLVQVVADCEEEPLPSQLAPAGLSF